MTTSTQDTSESLADEIERRRLKFADLPAGQFEMLSDEEHQIVINAIRALLPSPPVAGLPSSQPNRKQGV